MPPGIVRQVRRFFRAGPRGQRRGESRNHGVARAGHIRDLVRSENRDVRWL